MNCRYILILFNAVIALMIFCNASLTAEASEPQKYNGACRNYFLNKIEKPFDNTANSEFYSAQQERSWTGHPFDLVRRARWAGLLDEHNQPPDYVELFEYIRKSKHPKLRAIAVNPDDTMWFANHPTFRTHLMDPEQNGKNPRPTKILVIGVGAGRDLDFLIKHIRADAEIHVIDHSQELIDYNRYKYEKYTNVFLHHISVLEPMRKLKEKLGSFDLITWMFSGIVEMANSEKQVAMHNLRGILRQNGLLVIEQTLYPPGMIQREEDSSSNFIFSKANHHTVPDASFEVQLDAQFVTNEQISELARNAFLQSEGEIRYSTSSTEYNRDEYLTALSNLTELFLGSYKFDDSMLTNKRNNEPYYIVNDSLAGDLLHALINPVLLNKLNKNKDKIFRRGELGNIHDALARRQMFPGMPSSYGQIAREFLSVGSIERLNDFLIEKKGDDDEIWVPTDVHQRHDRVMLLYTH